MIHNHIVDWFIEQKIVMPKRQFKEIYNNADAAADTKINRRAIFGRRRKDILFVPACMIHIHLYNMVTC